MTITILAEHLSEELVDDLITLIKESPGKTDLHIHIRDGEGQHQVLLKSKTCKITATNKLVSYIKSVEGVEYSFN